MHAWKIGRICAKAKAFLSITPGPSSCHYQSITCRLLPWPWKEEGGGGGGLQYYICICSMVHVKHARYLVLKHFVSLINPISESWLCHAYRILAWQHGIHGCCWHHEWKHLCEWWCVSHQPDMVQCRFDRCMRAEAADAEQWARNVWASTNRLCLCRARCAEGVLLQNSELQRCANRTHYSVFFFFFERSMILLF